MDASLQGFARQNSFLELSDEQKQAFSWLTELCRIAGYFRSKHHGFVGSDCIFSWRFSLNAIQVHSRSPGFKHVLVFSMSHGRSVKSTGQYSEVMTTDKYPLSLSK